VPFSLEQFGFADQDLRLQHLADRIDHPDSLLDRIASDLAHLWQDNIDAGPNERWEAGASYRVRALGGTTLVETGLMKASIVGRQTGPRDISVGSDLTVGNGWNLLAIHEFGADIQPHSAPWLTFRYPLDPSVDGWARKKQIRIPRRPTAPFDWDSQQLTPDAAALVQSDIHDHFAEPRP